MKQLSALKLSNLNKIQLEENELTKLNGGNYCAFGSDNQWANVYSGKCSCWCGNGQGDYYSNIGSDSSWSKSSGTIV